MNGRRAKLLRVKALIWHNMNTHFPIRRMYKMLKGRSQKIVPEERKTIKLPFKGDRSKYVPHQGAQECARRLRNV